MSANRDPISSDRSARLVSELEAGALLDSLRASLGLSAREIISTLVFASLGDPDSVGPALIQCPPAHPKLETALSLAALTRFFPASTRQLILSLSAGLLQIHDFWNASHIAAQEADDLGESRFSAYWHGIAHRREPDASNAAYWFRRVGKHPILPALSEAARPIIASHGDSRWSSRLLDKGTWDTFAMIDLCTQAKPGTADESLARRLQRLEMQVLMDATAGAMNLE
jgi:hypothetical protein